MKALVVCLYLLSAAFIAAAQDMNEYAQTDRIALNIPDAKSNSTDDVAKFINDHFNTDNQKVRAIYVWVISHIKYDKDSLHRVILDEDRDQLVTFAMRRKRGVCENFAAIFNDICRKSKLKSFVIEGYTKQEGSVDKISHAWCTVLIDNKWALFDPTWDAGMANRFTEPVNTYYYEASPNSFVQTHMPFDPMFQLLDYPISFKEFNTGNIKLGGGKTYFNYADSIKAFEQLDPLSAYQSSASRIERNGPTNNLINTKLIQLKMEIEIINQDKDSVMYNGAIADYNAGISNFNNFLNWRNNQFKPAKTNTEVQELFDDVEKHIASARAKLKDVNNSKATLTLNTGDVEAALDNLSKHAKEQQAFLKNYQATAKQD